MIERGEKSEDSFLHRDLSSHGSKKQVFGIKRIDVLCLNFWIRITPNLIQTKSHSRILDLETENGELTGTG